MVLVAKWCCQDYVTNALSPGNKCVFLKDRENCFRLLCGTDDKLQKNMVPESKCCHEEADTRLILHA